MVVAAVTVSGCSLYSASRRDVIRQKESIIEYNFSELSELNPKEFNCFGNCIGKKYDGALVLFIMTQRFRVL